MGDDVDDAAAVLAAREETEDGLVLPRPVPMKRVLLTHEAAEILEKGAAKGSLGTPHTPPQSWQRSQYCNDAVLDYFKLGDTCSHFMQYFVMCVMCL